MIQFKKSDIGFEAVANLMTNGYCLGCGLQVAKIGSMNKLSPYHIMAFEGFPKGTNEILKFAPYKLIESLSNNTWPDSLEFEEVPLKDKEILAKKSINELRYKGKSTYIIQDLIVMSNFVYFYETVLDSIKDKFGELSQWPDTLKFARVIRNTFAHSGRIYITNRTALPVHWKNYTYSYLDNGRQILRNDLNIVEIIVLIKEIESFL